jgi:hypothetical protein
MIASLAQSTVAEVLVIFYERPAARAILLLVVRPALGFHLVAKTLEALVAPRLLLVTLGKDVDVFHLIQQGVALVLAHSLVLVVGAALADHLAVAVVVPAGTLLFTEITDTTTASAISAAISTLCVGGSTTTASLCGGLVEVANSTRRNHLYC